MNAAGLWLAGGLTAAMVVLSTTATRRRAGPAPASDGDTLSDLLGVDPMETLTDTPRGIRNHNPLNIELGDPWRGLAPEQTDGRFAQFVDARYGFRAAARIMESYRRRGVTTLQQIIATWAPAHENDTRAYVDYVAKRAKIAPIQTVTRDLYPRLFEAMTMMENGQQPYTLAFIREGVSWA